MTLLSLLKMVTHQLEVTDSFLNEFNYSCHDFL